ncbi:MAG: hypothetical protein IH600_12210 [Bacteroidetes bacterium]|nr:hypothetical protein [Bacteroidota bacterium]
MGQQSLIIVALSSLLVGMSVLGFMGAWDFSNETTASMFEREQALNITRSGINLAISNLRHQKTWRTGFNNLSVTGGTVSVRVIDLGVDTVRITSVGTINGVNHRSVVEVKLSSIFPNVESALTIFGDSVEFHNDGKAFQIDGRDYLPDGVTLGTAQSVKGIGVQSSKLQADLIKHLDPKVNGNILGSGGTPSIGPFSGSNLPTLQKFYKDRATIVLPAGKYTANSVFGTLDKPEIVYVPGDLDWKGNIMGAGILVVDGKLEMGGNIQWQGIILSLSGDVTIELGGSGNPSVIGTVWVGNTSSSGVTNVKVNGSPSIRYSYLTLSKVLANLGLLDVEVIKYWE